jgi:hypothetical protein
VKNVTDPVTVKFKLKLSQLIDVVGMTITDILPFSSSLLSTLSFPPFLLNFSNSSPSLLPFFPPFLLPFYPPLLKLLPFSPPLI